MKHTPTPEEKRAILDAVFTPLQRERPLAASTGSAVCCDAMAFALMAAIVRQNFGPHFGTDVMPPRLTGKIVACPWCGKPQNAEATGSSPVR